MILYLYKTIGVNVLWRIVSFVRKVNINTRNELFRTAQFVTVGSNFRTTHVNSCLFTFALIGKYKSRPPILLQRVNSLLQKGSVAVCACPSVSRRVCVAVSQLTMHAAYLCQFESYVIPTQAGFWSRNRNDLLRVLFFSRQHSTKSL